MSFFVLVPIWIMAIMAGYYLVKYWSEYDVRKKP